MRNNQGVCSRNYKKMENRGRMPHIKNRGASFSAARLFDFIEKGIVQDPAGMDI